MSLDLDKIAYLQPCETSFRFFPDDPYGFNHFFDGWEVPGGFEWTSAADDIAEKVAFAGAARGLSDGLFLRQVALLVGGDFDE